MSQSQAVALIVVLVALVAAVSALAGALWIRLRSRPGEELAGLARELTDRLHALDEATRSVSTARAEPGQGIEAEHRPARPAGAPAPRLNRFRLDPAEPTAITGPTLISIPDLEAPPNEAATAAAELGRRFGAIWALADSGASTDAIARATGHPIGQVELILGLRRQLDAAAAGSGTA